MNVHSYFPLSDLRHIVSSPNKNCQDLVKKLDNAFESLKKILMESNLDLPLEVEGVESCSSSLRHSDLFPPEPHFVLDVMSKPADTNKVASGTYYKPVDVNIKLSNSSKSPVDRDALSAAKSAFLVCYSSLSCWL